MQGNKKAKILLIFLIAFFAGSALIVSQAYALSYSFSSGSGAVGASADFEILANSDLQVTLTNTGTGDVLNQSYVLTALFFSIAGGPSLTPVSAEVPTGSYVYSGNTQLSVTNVGGEWAYEGGLNVTFTPTNPGLSTITTNEGISSSGLGIFGNGNFNGPELQGPKNSDAVDGVQYGITSAGDDLTTGNKPLTDGSNDLIKNSVVFELSDLPTGFELSQIGNVVFQYGTSLDEPWYPPGGGGGGGGSPVPEPATLLLMGIGLLGVGLGIRKRVN